MKEVKKVKPNYQMEFKWSGGGKSWEYFYATETVHEIAAAVANEYMKKRKSAAPTYSFLPYEYHVESLLPGQEWSLQIMVIVITVTMK